MLSQSDARGASGAVRIAEQGCFWVGVDYTESDEHTTVDGTQLFVDFQRPEEQTQPYPVVLIHGGGGQGVDWMSTPDGRPGWRTLLLQRGYAVYTIDRPGHGRSPTRPSVVGSSAPPSVEAPGVSFTGANNPEHTQWPGTGEAEDPALAQWLASQVVLPDLVVDNDLMRRRGTELLDRIGPSIIIAHSAGGPAAWLMANDRPDLVQAVVALEPLGPSGPFPLPWGLAASALTYDPPAPRPGDLDLIDIPATDEQPVLRLQSDPPRRLPNLASLPIAIVTGEQSVAAAMDAGTTAFLRQAGCNRVDHLRLADLGIRGNGHLMMAERNNAQILDAVTTWLSSNISR